MANRNDWGQENHRWSLSWFWCRMQFLLDVLKVDWSLLLQLVCPCFYPKSIRVTRDKSKVIGPFSWKFNLILLFDFYSSLMNEKWKSWFSRAAHICWMNVKVVGAFHFLFWWRCWWKSTTVINSKYFHIKLWCYLSKSWLYLKFQFKFFLINY